MSYAVTSSSTSASASSSCPIHRETDTQETWAKVHCFAKHLLISIVSTFCLYHHSSLFGIGFLLGVIYNKEAARTAKQIQDVYMNLKSACIFTFLAYACSPVTHVVAPFIFGNYVGSELKKI